MSIIKVGGYLPSVASSNDYPFTDLVTKINLVNSSSNHNIPEFTPISSQGSLSSCTCNAAMDGLEILLGLENKNKVIQLSRLFPYYNARALNNSTDKDAGTYITSVFQTLKQIGVCPESEWPYIEAKVNSRPALEAYKTAYDNRISAYYKISEDVQLLKNIETSVRANYPVVFAVPIDQKFVNYFNSLTTIDVPSNNLAGWHAMIVVGVRENNGALEFCWRNSWGTMWGQNGHCWVSADYMRMAKDIWVMHRAPDLIV